MTSQERELKKQAVIDYMKILPVKKYACANAGISRETLDNWLESDKEFLTQFQEAKAKFFSDKTKKARPEFLLERLDRETFGDKKELDVKVNPVDTLLKEFGIEPIGSGDDRKGDEPISGSSKS
tara:strand:+ start:151 stop:522 length:372 start_codon:yes stop_codon:yes gene_type:complete